MHIMAQDNPGSLVVSLDFELQWGVRDQCSLASSRLRLDGVYTVVPELLRSFSQYDVHATWATVGMLFFESKQDLVASLPTRRPQYQRSMLSPYLDLDCVGSDYRTDPYHFAPKLITQIADSRNQEIGTHTFSHYYCLESGQSTDDFKSDLKAAIAIAKKSNIELKSIVFPRNQYTESHLYICDILGFTSYRGNQHNWFWYPRKRSEDTLLRRGMRLLDAYVPMSGPNCWAMPHPHPGQPIDVTASRFLRPVGSSLTWLDSQRLVRIKKEMLEAARSRRMYHLWWHPENFGAHAKQNIEFLSMILEWFDYLRKTEGMRSLNMSEFANIAREGV
jgi:peptidoglycan/xylan/chitin deacetylase (PgdA/CDA1 family)